MVDMKWERVNCHICNLTKDPEPIQLNGKPLLNGQFGYSVHPVICKCGLVYLNPRWSKKDYSVFYENYYDDLYRLEEKPDYGVQGVIKNMAKIWDRINVYVEKRPLNILDVGCGSGYGLKYLQAQLPGSLVYGIESSPKCCKVLMSEVIGATLVTTDIASDWIEKYQGKFDLIILRHVVEHMLDPVESLQKLKTALSKKGIIYFSTPDMMHPRIILRDYDNWWEYWFRAVHPYYYCKGTLFKTLELAGLYPLVHGEENEEVWCLASLRKTETIEFNGVYKEQKKILDFYLKVDDR